MLVSNRKPVLVLAFLAMALLLTGARASAQTTAVTLEGSVTDDQGSPLPGATVSAKNVDTGYTKSATTKEDGRYILSGLQAGNYELDVSIPGFATEIRKGLTFTLGNRLTFNFVLKQTAIAEEVVITAQSPMVETTKSEVSAVVDRVKIDSLPLLDRDFGALTLVKAGVAAEYGDIRSNAQPYGSEDILTDGVSNEWVGRNTVNMAIPADAIQEFRVMTNQYEAEYGNASGMVRSALTRSGTNEFHGRAALFYRDEYFDNVNYFVNHDGYNTPELSEGEYEKAPFSHYNWSGNIGGPIVRDKAHFFLIYEGINHKEYSNVTAPIAEPETLPWTQTNTQVMFKLNYQLSEKNLFSFRYGLNRPRQSDYCPGGMFTKSTSYDNNDTAHDFQLNWTNYPSDNTMNEVRAFYSYESYAMLPLAPEDSYFEMRPGGYSGKYPTLPQEITTKRYQFVDNLTLFLGNHSVKLGVDASRIISAGYVSQYVPGIYQFATDETFDETNFFTYPILLITSPKVADVDSPYWEVGLFAQDSWRVSSRLTLNYGLRYNYYQVQYLDIDTSDIRNFNPRFGFSWDPIGDGKTVIRGGVGTYSQNPQLNLGLLVGLMDQLIVKYFFYPGYPDPNVPNPFLPPIPYEPPVSTYQGEPDMVAPYTLQTTLGVQREFVTDLSIGLDFVWSKGQKLSRTENDNPVIPGTGGLRPDMTKADLFVFRMNGRSDYKGLYVTVSKRYSHGWSLDVAYTYSKGMADVEDEQTSQYSYDPDGWERMYGPTDFDARHRLAVIGIVDLLWGFQLSGTAYYRSSIPWTPFYPTDVNLDSLLSDMEPGKNRNSRRDYDLFVLNLRLSKYFNIDKFRFQIFGEVYNLTNRNNFGSVYQYIGTPDFGNPLAAGAPRQVQLGARFDF